MGLFHIESVSLMRVQGLYYALMPGIQKDFTQPPQRSVCAFGGSQLDA